MIAPARVAAYEILMMVSAGQVDLPTAIAHARESMDDERDRALAAEIATGVQRWRAALDHVIAHVAKRPIERLDTEVVQILRLSAYQLLHLTRVPASAVVDDAVNLAGKAGKRSASGLVNAVLRGLSRTRTSLPLPRRPESESDRDSALDYLSVTLSHPRWLAARWYDRLGFHRAEAWMIFDNHPAPLTLRTNVLRTSVADLQARLAAADVATRPGQFAPHALIVEKGRPLREPGADAGWFVVQDEASQLVALLAGEQPGPRILDTCASPGGKATAFAAAVHGMGSVVACDVRARRMALLAHTVRTTGADNIRLVQADATRALPFGQIFNTVVVDAPCSGLGTLRRDPDIRWRRRETDLIPLAVAQRQMLRYAADSVAPGGRLVYATCSSEPEENEHVVSAFLEGAPEFVALDARRMHTALSREIVDDRGHLRTEPDPHGLEAFFGAVFERVRKV